MKKIFLLVFISVLAGSCGKQKPADYAVISGTIKNTPSDSIPLYNLEGKVLKKISLDTTGAFRDTVVIEQPGTFILSDGNTAINLYLENGYKLDVSYNNDKNLLEDISFSGNAGAAFNRYKFETLKVWDSIQGQDIEAFYNSDRTVFVEKIAAIKTAQEKLLSRVKDIPDSLHAREKRHITYSGIALLQSYDQMHDEKFSEKDLEAIFPEYSSIDYANEADFYYSQMYGSLMRRYYKNRAQNPVEGNENKSELVYFNVVAHIKSDKIRNLLLYDEAFYNLQYALNRDAYYERFIELSTSKENKQAVTKAYNQLKLLKPGSASPTFVAYENHAGGTTSLSDFKGSYVFIDVWATWCGPCIKEIPALKKLEEKYAGKNLKFVSISIDTWQNHDVWRKMVNDKNLGGTQLLADNAWGSGFIQDYQIKGIPRFIIIDPSGNIVASEAFNPSDERIKRVIDTLSI